MGMQNLSTSYVATFFFYDNHPLSSCFFNVQNLWNFLNLQDSDNPDLRDRGYIYWRLLSTDPAAAKEVVLAEKPLISEETDLIEPTLLDELICHISSLASVYHKPPNSFVEGRQGGLRRALPPKSNSWVYAYFLAHTIFSSSSSGFVLDIQVESYKSAYKRHTYLFCITPLHPNNEMKFE